MDDLISRSNLMTTLNIKEDCHDCAYGASVFCTRGSDFVDACEAIMDAPSIDALEVVRCKDCRWGREVCGNIECFVDSNIPPEYHGYDWFCPNGERRTDG